MIVERTNYFAKPGKTELVLATRRKASAVRIALGLPAGTIHVKSGGDGPDVSWHCAFPDAAAHAADLKARADSPDFSRVRDEMRDVMLKFERHIEEQDGGADVLSERSLRD